MNDKKISCKVIQILCFIVIIPASLMIAGCVEVLTVGAVIVGTAIADEALKQKPVIHNTPVVKTYQPAPKPQPVIVEPVSKEPDYQSMRDDAIYDYQNLNWEKSEAMFQKLINENTSEYIQVESLIYLGAIYYQRGDINSAEHYFRQAKNMSLLTFPSSALFPPKMVSFYMSVKK